MADAVFDNCSFERSWVGLCNKPCHGKFCSKHENLSCVVCGTKAVRDCEYTGQFVCGAPLCADCYYTVDPEDTGLLFMKHKHCSKV
jgi:hypothetical protein